MPYNVDGKIYTRITELTSYVECEALSYIDKTKPFNRPTKANAVTLAGTLVHHKIAQSEMKKMKRPYKSIELEFNDQERFMFQEMILDHKEQRQIQQDNPERFKDMHPDYLKTKYEKIMEDVIILYNNYKVFLNDNVYKPVYIEEKKFYEPLLIAGTVDLVATFQLTGYVRKINIHSYFDVGEKEYFVEDPNGEPMMVATLLDWKSSKSKQKGHALQLSAYHLMWELLGEFDRLRTNGHIINAQSYSVLLGKRKKIPQYVINQGLPTQYQLFKYDMDSSPFLQCLEIRKSPRPIAMDVEGGIGIKGRCMFCNQIVYCPDNKMIPVNMTSQSIIPLTEFDLKDTTALVLLMSEMDNKSINNIKNKINDIHLQLEERTKLFNNTDIKDVIKEDFGIED